MSQLGAAVSSLESEGKGGLGDRLRGLLAQDELPPPAATLVVSLVGTLRV